MKPDTQSNKNQQIKAVIYCRSASTNQLKGDCNIKAQEKRFREFAKYKNYEIVQTFHDHDLSGNFVDRPGITKLLSFLKSNYSHSPHVVIIDDISRLARDLQTHADLKKAISNAVGILETPNFTFRDTPNSYTGSL